MRRPRPIPILLLALALSASQGVRADPPRSDLAGLVPGQSPAAAASAFMKAQPTWRLPDPDQEGTMTDALANDCAPAPGPSWDCSASLAGSGPSDPATAEVELQYAPSPGSPGGRALAKARLALAWEQPLDSGWEAFLSSRPAPAASGPIPKSKALALFSPDSPSKEAASAAKAFRAARWRSYAVDGSPTDVSAVAALDSKGRLLALLAESSSSGWGARQRRAPKDGPSLP